MRSQKKNRRRTPATSHSAVEAAHLVFFPMVVMILILWVLYRTLFSFPVWFDESVGKALFFGFPVWLFIAMTGHKGIDAAFSPSRFQPGMLLGLAFGGVYGFITAISSLLVHQRSIVAVALFESTAFWNEFSLALLTGFWESLLFYAFFMTIIMEKYAKWSLVQQVALTAVLFVAFHIPALLKSFDTMTVLGMVVVLSFFAVGQALIYAGWRNGYALLLSHAIWGMVLLVYTS